MEKNIIITGGGRGLGQSIALDLAGKMDPASLTLVARDRTGLEETAEKITEINHHCRVEIITGDLADSKGIGEVIARLSEGDLSYNILINNAGYGKIGSLEEIEDCEIEKMISVNLLAPLRLIKCFLSGARAQKWGRIINISSISVFEPSPTLTPYIVSKSGLDSLSRCVTLADLSNGITCNTIFPGLMLTETGKSSIKYSFPDYNTYSAPVIERKIAEHFPAKKLTETSEIAALINFLISDAGGAISGEFFRVASGLL